MGHDEACVAGAARAGGLGGLHGLGTHRSALPSTVALRRRKAATTTPTSTTVPTVPKPPSSAGSVSPVELLLDLDWASAGTHQPARPSVPVSTRPCYR